MAIVDLTFTRPDFLWYLLAIPFVFLSHFILLARTRRKAIRFANFEAMRRVSHDKLLTKNWTILILRIMILACLILAISGAKVWYTGTSNRNDFVLAIDVSASMSAQDVQPTRMDAAKDGAMLFTDAVRGESNIGLVTFSGVPFIITIPTADRDVLKKDISAIEILPEGGTDIGGAIITGTNLLIPAQKGKAIILLTDGSNTAGTFTENPVQKGINYAAANHVKVYTIGLGSNAGPIGYLPEYYNISATFDEKELRSIANQTSGEYYRALDLEGVQSAYANIAKNAENAILGYDCSYGLLLISLTLLFLEWGLANTKFRNVP